MSLIPLQKEGIEPHLCLQTNTVCFKNKFPHFLHTTFNMLLLNIRDVPGSLTGTKDAKINKAITLPSRTAQTGREDIHVYKLLQYIVISGEIKKRYLSTPL